jgi:hypothetical protein
VVRMVDRIRRRPPPTVNWGRHPFASRLIALGRLSSNCAEPAKRDTEEQRANCDEFKPNHAETRSAAQGVDGDACMMVTSHGEKDADRRHEEAVDRTTGRKRRSAFRAPALPICQSLIGRSLDLGIAGPAPLAARGSFLGRRTQLVVHRSDDGAPFTK